MINILQFLLLSFYLFSTWPCLAVVTPDQFQWKVFTNRSSIQDLVLLNQEKTLWVSTNGGLEQRDGQSGELIRVFTHVSTLPVSDGQGGEWGINRSGKLVHLSQAGEWEVYTHENSGLPNSPVNSLVSEAATLHHGPRLWIGTHRGLVQADMKGERVEWNVLDMSNSPLPDNFVRVLVGDGHGGVWLETRNGDYVHVSSDQEWNIVETTEAYLPEPPSYFFSSDDQGGLWLYGNAFNSEAPLLHLINNDPLTVHKPIITSPLMNTIKTLLSDGQGGLWIGNQVSPEQTALVAHLNEQGEWTFYASPLPKVSWYSANVLARSAQGGLWVGIWNSLYYLTSQGTWQTDKIIGPSGTEWLNISALAPDSQGGVWIGTGDGHGLIHLRYDGEVQKFNTGLPNTYIDHFISDGIGGIWLVLPMGMAHLNQQDDEWTVIDSQNSRFPPDFYYQVEYFVSDSKGGVCAGGTSLHLHVTTQEIKTFSDQEQLPNACLENLNQSGSDQYVSDGQGGIWEKVYNGLVHQNSQGQRTVFNQTNSPLPSTQINTLLSDGEGGVWIGCGDNLKQGGLAHVSGDAQWFVFTSSNSDLPNNYVESLISDYQGGLWVKTYDGAAHRLAHLLVQQPAVNLPVLGLGTSSNSSFAGGSSVNGQPYQAQVTVTSADQLTVKGEITVDPDHVGLTTDLVVYAEVLHGQDTLLVMLDKQGRLQVWDQQLDHLVPFKEKMILQTQQSLSIYQGRLTTLGMKKIFFGYRLPDGKTILSPTGIEIQVSLPVLGAAVDISQHHLPTTTWFHGGTSVNGQAYQTQVVQKLTDSAQVTGDITVEAAHVGQVADIVVYAETGFPLSATPIYFMLGEGLNILSWDQKTDHLVPFMRQMTLEPLQHVSIYQGNFYLPGHLKVFFGYRLSNGTTVINTQAIDISILE